MKAMILAAGLGTRLLPLTSDKPKALVEVEGRPLLEWVILRLRQSGFDELIINVHHFAEQIIEFVRRKNSFGLRIEFSREDVLLDTGGGLKQAGWFFNDDQPFLLHNVDVLTDLDYPALLRAQKSSGALAMLAVRQRKTSRYLLFDESGQLCGWESVASGERKLPRQPVGELRRLSFMGIHALSPSIIKLLSGQGAFSIIDAYLRLAGEGHKILVFPTDECQWIDLGRPQNISQAAHLLASPQFSTPPNFLSANSSNPPIRQIR